MKREKELEQVVATQKKELEAKDSQDIPVGHVPNFHHRLPLRRLQKVDELEEELTCEICATRMWLPYRCASFYPHLVQWSLTTGLG